MPIPLPEDNHILRRVIEDASAIAVALERTAVLWRRVRAFRGTSEPGWHDDERRLCELLSRREFHGPEEARIRVRPYLPGASQQEFLEAVTPDRGPTGQPPFWRGSTTACCHAWSSLAIANSSRPSNRVAPSIRF